MPKNFFSQVSNTNQRLRIALLGDWNNFYAIGVTERLGLESTGGMVRVGFVHYNTLTEIGRLLDCLTSIAKRN